MIGDVLIFKPVHDCIAKSVFSIIEANGIRGKEVISIAGESGTGKSEIAHEIRILLKEKGFRVKIFHLDNYYDTEPEERTEIRHKRGIDSVGDNEILWEKLEKDIVRFRSNKRARIPFIDLYTRKKDILNTCFKDVDILLIEGLYATRASADYKFFIDLTYHDTKKQRKQRKKEIQDDFRMQVLEQEHNSVQSHKPTADYLIQLNGLPEGECKVYPNPEKQNK